MKLIEESHLHRKQKMDSICELLGISKTYLAGLLGVTEQTLANWESVKESTPKAERLSSLYKMIQFISLEFPQIPKEDYRDILVNARVELDKSDPQDGSVSLNGIVLSCLPDSEWKSLTVKGINDYLTGLNKFELLGNSE